MVKILRPVIDPELVPKLIKRAKEQGRTPTSHVNYLIREDLKKSKGAK